MSRVESGYLPLPKVEQEQPEDNLEIKLNLPQYVDQDRIGVNLTEIVRLNNWGGIKGLRVVGKMGMGTSSEVPEIAGINSDGSASASKKVAKVEVPTFESYSSDYDWDAISIANRWKNVGINLNLDEMVQKIKERPEGVRSAKNWSKELDNGIKEPIRREGHQNLLHDLEFLDKRDLKYLITFGGVFSILNYIASGGPPFYVLLGTYTGNRLSALFISKKLNLNFRFSLTPAYQLDRAAILSVASRIKTVVNDLHEKK